MFRSRSKKPAQQVAPDVVVDEDALVVVDRAVDPYAVMFHDSTGYRAEQFRGLRNKLLAMNPDGESKTLVVTSAIKGEGKTVCSVNLAMAFAELENRKILLIDADLRAPRVERALHLSPRPGVADVLLGRSGLEECIRSSGIANLDVLGPGSRLDGPSELLATARVRSILEELKETYQYVLIDTPPVLAATDAAVVASKVDGCLISVRLERSNARLTKDAVREIEDLGGNVLGCFVTDVRGGDPEQDPRLAYTRRESEDEDRWGA